jgi:hypothetical protein
MLHLGSKETKSILKNIKIQNNNISSSKESVPISNNVVIKNHVGHGRRADLDDSIKGVVYHRNICCCSSSHNLQLLQTIKLDSATRDRREERRENKESEEKRRKVTVS